MNIDQQHILFVEDDRLTTMIYSDALEDVGFKTGPSFDYELDNMVAHVAYTRAEAQTLVRFYPFDIVFLDHNLDDKQTSEHLAADILKRNADCQLYLTSGSPIIQIEAVTRSLHEAGLQRYVSELKTHGKGDYKGLISILNGIIRPPSFSADAAQRNHLKHDN